MALIEGIGDEVLHFFLVLLLLVIAAAAWCSTRISDRPLIRTVLILERMQPRQQPVPSAPPPPEDTKPEDAETSASSAELETNIAIAAEDNSSPENLSTLRNRRLAFFQEPSISSNLRESCQQIINKPTNVDKTDDSMQAGENTIDPTLATPEEHEILGQCDTEHSQAAPDPLSDSEINIQSNPGAQSSKPVDKNEPASVTSEEAPSIRIRLKYLNDDLKLVEGSLQEQLGDFKKRHFSMELSRRKLVRLIFNGQVLGQDTCTLGHYGLYDNCVVHCLVHQPRTPPPSPNLSTRGEHGRGTVPPISPWALSNVLLASLSLLLGLAWYGRYQYAQLYTATTTVALVGLTGIFTVSLIGIYMADPAHPS